MNIKTTKAFLTFFTALLISGCATTEVYISSLTDSQYSVTPTQKIAVFFDESANIEERNFYHLLVGEMQRAGFNLVEIQECDFVLTYSLGEKTSRIDSSLPVSNTSTTYGNISGYGYRESTTFTSYVPYSYNYTVSSVYMCLYPRESIVNKTMRTAWEGYIGAEKKIFEKYHRECVATLLQYFGSHHEAHTPIVKIKDE